MNLFDEYYLFVIRSGKSFLDTHFQNFIISDHQVYLNFKTVEL